MMRKAPKRRRMSRNDMMAGNPVIQATMRKQIMEECTALRTSAGLHAHIGSNAQSLADAAGRLIYIVCHAARAHELHDSPEARILAGTANALGDLVEIPERLDAMRSTIISGLNACERLIPKLNSWNLMGGVLNLEIILAQRNCTTGDIQDLLKQEAV